MRLLILFALLAIVISKTCNNNCDCATSSCVNMECVNGTCNENVNCTKCTQLQFFGCWNGVAHCENKPTWG